MGKIPIETKYFSRELIMEEVQREGLPIKIIKGIATKADVLNDNDRYYTLEECNKFVERAQPKVMTGKILGEVDHPEKGKARLANSAFLYTKIYMDNDLVRYEGDVLPTPAGDLLSKLIRSKVGVGNSTRGFALLDRKVDPKTGKYGNWVKDFDLTGIDFVVDESNEFAGIEYYESKNNDEGGSPMNEQTKTEKVEESSKNKTAECDGSNAMDKKMKMKGKSFLAEEFSLAMLKENFPELITQLHEEFTNTSKENVEESINVRVSKLLQENKEKFRQEIMEDKEIKLGLSVINSVKDMIVPKEETKELVEESKLRNLETELARVTGILQEKLDKEAKEVLIMESLQGYKHKDLLEKRLRAYAKSEEIKVNLDREKSFIDEVFAQATKTEVTESKVNTGNGVVNIDAPKEETPVINFDAARMRKLAGLS